MLLVITVSFILYGSTANNVEQNKTVKREAVPLVINTDKKPSDENVQDKNNEIAESVKEVQEESNTSTGEAVAIVTYDDIDNIDLLARLVHAEVGNLNYEAKIATASAVINRMNHDSYPASIYGVIYESGQYETVLNDKINEPSDEESYRAAEYVYNHGSQIPENVIYQAQFVQGTGVYMEIEGEYFCYG